MISFSKKVDLRSRKAMRDFLLDHFRYNTMNTWNQSTSYANNVKIYRLGLTNEQVKLLFSMIDTEDFYYEIRGVMSDFARQHGYLWQAGFNGRSNGYLVLYQGYIEPTEYKSYCSWCYQKSYKTVEETGDNRCSICGRHERINYEQPPSEIGVYPGHPTDMYEDFEDWSVSALRQRVELVQDFDRMCDEMLRVVVHLLDSYEVAERTIYVPKTIKVLQEVS